MILTHNTSYFTASNKNWKFKDKNKQTEEAKEKKCKQEATSEAIFKKIFES
jgi:hypothetical protein